MAYYLGLSYQSHHAAYFDWDNEPIEIRKFGLSSNVLLTAANLPDSATRSRGKQTPDIFPMPGLNAVSARFREIVEQFEPNMHFFHPITLKEKDGSPISADYFIFCARIAIDCVLTKKSEIVWKDSGNPRYPPHAVLGSHTWEDYEPSHPKSRAKREEKFGILASMVERGHAVTWPKHLYVSKPAISEHHIWTGNRIFRNDIWVSDAFFNALENAKLKGLSSHAYGFEIDAPWIPELEIAPILDWVPAR